MINKTLTPTGWLITETVDEKEIMKYGPLTAQEKELSQKFYNTQRGLLEVRELFDKRVGKLEIRADKIETVIETALIARGSSTDKV